MPRSLIIYFRVECAGVRIAVLDLLFRLDGRIGCTRVVGEPVQRGKGEGTVGYDESGLARVVGPGMIRYAMSCRAGSPHPDMISLQIVNYDLSTPQPYSVGRSSFQLHSWFR